MGLRWEGWWEGNLGTFFGSVRAEGSAPSRGLRLRWEFPLHIGPYVLLSPGVRFRSQVLFCFLEEQLVREANGASRAEEAEEERL